MVEYYNDRLTEREKRRDFLRARGLLNMKRMQVHFKQAYVHLFMCSHSWRPQQRFLNLRFALRERHLWRKHHVDCLKSIREVLSV